MSLLSKFKSAIGLLAFLGRYPVTSIVGGPNSLAWLGARHISQPRGFFSQSGQDAFLVNHLFQVIHGAGFPKTFVDVGCNHPVKHNNSLFFERYMGFKVLAVDALPTHQLAWAEQRPQAELVITAVGSEEGTVEFEEVEHGGRERDMFSSVSGASGKAQALGRRMRTVPITPLTKILQSHGLTSVGIMSIDIEGYEMHALQGIDFDAIQINAIILENNSDAMLGDDTIRDFLIGKHYRFIARIWGMDDVFVHERLDLQNTAPR
jgi:FkbM family methyltransferase